MYFYFSTFIFQLVSTCSVSFVVFSFCINILSNSLNSLHFHDSLKLIIIFKVMHMKTKPQKKNNILLVLTNNLLFIQIQYLKNINNNNSLINVQCIDYNRFLFYQLEQLFFSHLSKSFTIRFGNNLLD